MISFFIDLLSKGLPVFRSENCTKKTPDILLAYLCSNNVKRNIESQQEIRRQKFYLSDEHPRLKLRKKYERRRKEKSLERHEVS